MRQGVLFALFSYPAITVEFSVQYNLKITSVKKKKIAKTLSLIQHLDFSPASGPIEARVGFRWPKVVVSNCPMPNCPGAQLSWCPIVLVPICPGAQFCGAQLSDVQLFWCPFVRKPQKSPLRTCIRLTSIRRFSFTSVLKVEALIFC